MGAWTRHAWETPKTFYENNSFYVQLPSYSHSLYLSISLHFYLSDYKAVSLSRAHAMCSFSNCDSSFEKESVGRLRKSTDYQGFVSTLNYNAMVNWGGGRPQTSLGLAKRSMTWEWKSDLAIHWFLSKMWPDFSTRHRIKFLIKTCSTAMILFFFNNY